MTDGVQPILHDDKPSHRVGLLAVAVGTLAIGDEMRANFGVFLTFRDGRITRQRDYDCFQPF
jgi:ketosteroid isomerase-like protein